MDLKTRVIIIIYFIHNFHLVYYIFYLENLYLFTVACFKDQFLIFSYRSLNAAEKFNSLLLRLIPPFINEACNKNSGVSILELSIFAVNK